MTDFDIFGPFGWNVDSGIDWAAPIAIDPLNLNAHLHKDWLLIAEPMAPSSGVDDGLDLFPPFGEIDDGGWGHPAAMRETLYVACTRGRSTANDDEPPAQYVPGRLLPWVFTQRIFDGVDPLQRGQGGNGVIRLADPDGGLNALNAKNWDSVPLTIKRGAPGTLFSSWPVVGRFKSAALLRDMDEKQIATRNLAWQLDAPLHGETFAGTGGREGEAAIAGQLKLYAAGPCEQVEPKLISVADQIFCWSLSSSQEVRDLWHGAIPLEFHQDYADYAALAAASIPSSKYGTCLAESLARPNVTLQYGIRVDVVGDGDTVNGHGPPMTRGQIIRRIITSYGANYLDEASEIDTASFQRMDNYHSAPCGFYFGGEITKAQAVERILRGILGWSRVAPDGKFSVGWVEAPEQLIPAVTFTFGAHGMGKPQMTATAPPRRGTRIGYKFNNAPQPDRGSLAPLADDDDARRFGEEAQFKEQFRPSIASLYPTSNIVTIADSGFDDPDDAQNECDRQQAIFDIQRYRWTIEMQVDPLVGLIGFGAALAGAPEIVGEGRAMLCAAIGAAGTSMTTFEFFV